MMSAHVGLSIMQPVRPMSPDNIVLLTLDSCRYDVFLDADMPFCKSLGRVQKAQAPANFTYASHQAFFEFINFAETHFPYGFEGKEDQCPVTVLARTIQWPPSESGPVGKANPAYPHQVAAASFLDKPILRLVSNLPGHTFVIVCGDH